jgi:hypothetical protein
MRRHLRHAAPLLALILLAGGCGGDDSPTPTEPTPLPTVTEIFSGTIPPNGAATHPFGAQRSGTVTATLTTVGPDNTVRIGLSLGTWNGVLCQTVLSNDQAVQGTIITGIVSSLGTLCTRVYDIGTLTQPASYEVQVVHP